MSKMVCCPYCDRTSDRFIEGCCAHCSRIVPYGAKKCPACQFIFTRALIVSEGENKQRFCPNPDCGVELYYAVTTKGTRAVLVADKETCQRIVRIAEEFISGRTGTIFTFGATTPGELVFAYALLDRSKTFFHRQPDNYGIDPHEFVVELVVYILSKWIGPFGSIKMMLNCASGYAAELFRQKKLNAQMNRARTATFIDYHVFEVEWN